jgi:hypothetical protein
MIGHGETLAAMCLLYHRLQSCANPAKEQDEQINANGLRIWLTD